MSDPTPRTTICPDCSALIPHNGDEMRNHRSFHNDLKAKHDGVRKRLSEQDDKIARAVREAADAHHAANNIEIPEPPKPLEIADAPDEWDELPTYTPPAADDEPVSTYADDLDYTPTTPAAPTHFGAVPPVA